MCVRLPLMPQYYDYAQGVPYHLQTIDWLYPRLIYIGNLHRSLWYPACYVVSLLRCWYIRVYTKYLCNIKFEYVFRNHCNGSTENTKLHVDQNDVQDVPSAYYQAVANTLMHWSYVFFALTHRNISREYTTIRSKGVLGFPITKGIVYLSDTTNYSDLSTGNISTLNKLRRIPIRHHQGNIKSAFLSVLCRQKYVLLAVAVFIWSETNIKLTCIYTIIVISLLKRQWIMYLLMDILVKHFCKDSLDQDRALSAKYIS